MTERMRMEAGAGPRPEAMADVPGGPEVALTRAVVQYRDLHEIDPVGGRIEDIGLALVLEGRSPASADAVDLGSAEVKRLDLSTELVVLDWVYRPTLEHVSRLLEKRTRGVEAGARTLGPYCFDLARHVLRRIGFGPLTRPTLLRIGFRDVCRDLDLHEGTSVRITLDGRAVARAHLDYDSCALVFRAPSGEASRSLEQAVTKAFPGREVRRMEPDAGDGPVTYHVRFDVPLSFPELREVLQGMRQGLVRLIARFEPRRFRATRDVLDVLGDRETLSRLRLRGPRTRNRRVRSGSRPDRRTVH